MGYDHGDSFPFDFEPNGIPFGSENRKEICHRDHIPFNVKGIGGIVFSERRGLLQRHRDSIRTPAAKLYLASCGIRAQFLHSIFFSVRKFGSLFEGILNFYGTYIGDFLLVWGH